MHLLSKLQYQLSCRPMNISLQKLQFGINPEYLIQVSHHVECLADFYQQQSLPPISTEYRNLLQSSFTSLSQSLQLYSNSYDSASMVSASIVKCKSEIEIYCLQKLGFLLKRETEQLGSIIEMVVEGYKRNMNDFQKILISERRRRVQMIQNEKDKMIEKLKHELIDKKQYIAELNQRIQQIQQDNSKLYERMISKAKITTERALSPSPKKKNLLLPNASLLKLKEQVLIGSSHKTLTGKQVEQIIMDIMETKQKQEQVKGKRVSLKLFLKTYFRYKFGMKELADQSELNFRQAVQFYSQSQQKNIFILFLKMLSEDCEEQYFWEQKIFYDRLTRVIKRYLNEKQGKSLDDLQRLYDSKIVDERLDVQLNEKDVQYILINIYKTSDVDSLQMILNEILIQKIDKLTGNDNSEQILIPSKKFINQILNYELSRHILKIQDIVRVIKDVDEDRGYLNQENLQTAIIRLNIPQQKIQANLDMLLAYEGRFITYSQSIEIIEKIRRLKGKKSIDKAK